MNVLAKFDEIPSMILQDIKETKRYGHKNVSNTWSDNVKTAPTNTVCGGYKEKQFLSSFTNMSSYTITIPAAA